MLHRFRHAEVLRRTFFGAAIAGFALALLIAVSPQLHELVHHDGNALEHQCLATVMQSGGCDGASPEALVVSAFLTRLFATVPSGASVWVESVFASGCVFEHAPPFVS